MSDPPHTPIISTTVMARAFVLVCLLATVAVGQSPAVGPSTAPAPPGTVQADSARRASAESTIVLLRAQLATMKDYEQQLLSTVHWSLGGIITAALVLVTAGWFANFRVYERDKTALRDEVRALVGAELTQASAKLAAEATASRDALSTQIRQAEQSTRSRIEVAVKGVRDSLAQEIKARRVEIARLQIAQAQSEAASWHERKVFTNVIRSLIPAVEIAQAHIPGAEYVVPGILDRIAAAFRAGAKPDADLTRQLVAVLDKLPAEYSAVVEGLRTAIRSSQV